MFQKLCDIWEWNVPLAVGHCYSLWNQRKEGNYAPRNWAYLISRFDQLERMNKRRREHSSDPSSARNLGYLASLSHAAPDFPISGPPYNIEWQITRNPHHIAPVEAPKALIPSNLPELVEEFSFLTGP
jgi:hypothetical protein